MRIATRDYARQQRPAPRRGSRPAVGKSGKSGKPPARSAALGLPLWAWMILSLSLLLFAGALYYVARPVAPMDMAPSSGQPAKASRSIEIPPKEPSRFAFYEMLPSYEVVVPDEVLNPPKPKPGASRNNLPRDAAAKPATAGSNPDIPADLQAVVEPPPIVEKPVTATLPKPSEPAATAVATLPSPSRAASAPKPVPPPADARPQPTAQLASGEKFLIQVAAFRTRADAEQRVAGLTLAGLAARVEQVTIDNKDTWYRVRLGPYGTAAAAAAAQQALKAQGFSGVVLKVKS